MGNLSSLIGKTLTVLHFYALEMSCVQEDNIHPTIDLYLKLNIKYWNIDFCFFSCQNGWICFILEYNCSYFIVLMKMKTLLKHVSFSAPQCVQIKTTDVLLCCVVTNTHIQVGELTQVCYPALDTWMCQN